MLPRRPDHLPNPKSIKPPSLKPASLLSFGIRTLPKDQPHPRNPKHPSEKPPSKSSQNTNRNFDENNPAFAQNTIHAPLSENSNSSRQYMENQNLVFKTQSAHPRSEMMDFNRESKQFTDQICQAPSFLKLNNITNIHEQQQAMINEDKKKITLLCSSQFQEDKVFKEESQNQIQKIYVDMKKKIKKLSKSKRFMHSTHPTHIHLQPMIPQGQPQTKQQLIALHQYMMRTAYSDNDVICDASIFRSKLINQRIDNDVDTDQEQIESGIKRLKKSLQDAVQQNRNSTLYQTRQIILNSQNCHSHWLDEQSCSIEVRLC